MKEWLKEFVCHYYDWRINMLDERNVSVFIDDYIKEHSLPLPTGAEIMKKSLECPAPYGFRLGANWMKSKMEGK